MEKIELQGNVGDEYCLVYGDKTLVIKLTDAMIVPDFVESVAAIADKNPRVFLQVAEDRWHHKLGYIQSVRSGLARLREEAFSFSVDSKDVQDNTELPKETKKTAKKKKQNDVEDAGQKVAEKQE
ncbi:MAG: hypothetical protein J6K25_05025 [Thermoguttaceae bacterium]|nr:hypothetical protein [Thermoguttaceae bacterium]